MPTAGLGAVIPRGRSAAARRARSLHPAGRSAPRGPRADQQGQQAGSWPCRCPRPPARDAIDLIKIRTLAEAGVPLARITALQAAPNDAFRTALIEIDDGL